ncbi:uncharacterized protein [Ambystoma mexicanum]|uniref:uncharacterized protein n=1 Tax=Ambystoma mexicanum TaxID=8296 RepID=UPI0037E70AEE
MVFDPSTPAEYLQTGRSTLRKDYTLHSSSALKKDPICDVCTSDLCGVCSGGSGDMRKDMANVSIVRLTLMIWMTTNSFDVTTLPDTGSTALLRKCRDHGRDILPSSVMSMSFVRHGYAAIVKQAENIWVFLARRLLNISHFCMADVNDASNLISMCLVAVPTPVPVLRHIFIVLHNDSLVEDSDVRNSFSVYEYCTFCSYTDCVWRNMTCVVTYNIALADVCYLMTCDPQHIGKCQQLDLTDEKSGTDFEKRLCARSNGACTDVSNTMFCNFTVVADSHLQHGKLPIVWLFSCGNFTYTYIPANISGGPCALTWLGLMMFPLQPGIH